MEINEQKLLENLTNPIFINEYQENSKRAIVKAIQNSVEFSPVTNTTIFKMLLVLVVISVIMLVVFLFLQFENQIMNINNFTIAIGSILIGIITGVIATVMFKSLQCECKEEIEE